MARDGDGVVRDAMKTARNSNVEGVFRLSEAGIGHDILAEITGVEFDGQLIDLMLMFCIG
ncbi:TPA: hypothetical protein ACNAIP_002219 [Citrobacter amalonaticus]